MARWLFGCWFVLELPPKDSLVADAVRMVEAAYRSIMDTVLPLDESPTLDSAFEADQQFSAATVGSKSIDLVVPFGKPVRRRSNARPAYIRRTTVRGLSTRDV